MFILFFYDMFLPFCQVIAGPTVVGFIVQCYDTV